MNREIIDWNNCHTSEQLDSISTTKNDLGVERQIKEICISYPKSNLKEHDGKPYYTIKYVENSKEYQGYGTYKIEVLMEYLKNYFMPPATPQEPRKGKWTKISNTVPCMNCPICGSTFTLIQGGNKMHYCPNCGAEMESEG